MPADSTLYSPCRTFSLMGSFSPTLNHRFHPQTSTPASTREGSGTMMDQPRSLEASPSVYKPCPAPNSSLPDFRPWVKETALRFPLASWNFITSSLQTLTPRLLRGLNGQGAACSSSVTPWQWFSSLWLQTRVTWEHALHAPPPLK